MVVSCCVVNCTRRFKPKDIPFYRLPKDESKRQKWLAAINRKNWFPTEHDRVCGSHFISGKKSDSPNDPDYVPNVNMGYTVSTADPLSSKKRFERTQIRSGKKQGQEELEAHKRRNLFAAEALLDLSNTNNENLIPPSENNLQGCDNHAGDHHDSCLQMIADLRNKNKKAMDELARLQEENLSLRQQLNAVKFTDSFLEDENKDARTRFFTGLPHHASFVWMVKYLSDVLPKCKALSPGSVLLMILMKLRLNIQHQDLAYRFSVSQTVVSDILNQGLPQLARKLCFLVQWPNRETVHRNLPDVFRETYKKCRHIIDCCEIFIERPGNLTARATSWSNYKHHNTIKFLVAITPTGSVSFISKAFGGRTSDKVITLRSGFLDLLEYDDQVLADRGFLIAEEVASRNAYLIMPAFTKGKNQLSAREVEKSRRIARVRIHVERAIERIKNFKILSSTMSLRLVPHSNNIMTICASLSNLHPKLVN